MTSEEFANQFINDLKNNNSKNPHHEIYKNEKGITFNTDYVQMQLDKYKRFLGDIQNVNFE